MSHKEAGKYLKPPKMSKYHFIALHYKHPNEILHSFPSYKRILMKKKKKGYGINLKTKKTFDPIALNLFQLYFL